MSKKRQAGFIMCIAAIVCIVFGWTSGDVDALEVKLVADPSDTTIEAGSGLIALTAEVEGTDLNFEWLLVGAGTLEGDTTQQAVLYVPPEKVEGKSTRALVSVKVKDYKGKEVTKSLSFKIIPTNPPVVTDKGVDECTSIKAYGEIVDFSPKEAVGNFKYWRSFGWVKTAFGVAKKAKASEVAVQQTVFVKSQNRRYTDLWRFSVHEGSILYYAWIPDEPQIDVGACWEKAKEMSGSSFTVDGVKYKHERDIFYILK